MTPDDITRPKNPGPPLLFGPAGAAYSDWGGAAPPSGLFPYGRGRRPPHTCATEARTRWGSALFFSRSGQAWALGALGPTGYRATHFHHHRGTLDGLGKAGADGPRGPILSRSQARSADRGV